VGCRQLAPRPQFIIAAIKRGFDLPAGRAGSSVWVPAAEWLRQWQASFLRIIRLLIESLAHA
jgi:hypothetical protein